MIKEKGKEVVRIVSDGRELVKIVENGIVLWEGSASCFAAGYWKDAKPWTDNKAWKD